MTDREKLIKILDKANIEHEDYVYTDGTPAIDARRTVGYYVLNLQRRVI